MHQPNRGQAHFNQNQMIYQPQIQQNQANVMQGQMQPPMYAVSSGQRQPMNMGPHGMSRFATPFIPNNFQQAQGYQHGGYVQQQAYVQNPSYQYQQVNYGQTRGHYQVHYVVPQATAAAGYPSNVMMAPTQQSMPTSSAPHMAQQGQGLYNHNHMPQPQTQQKAIRSVASQPHQEAKSRPKITLVNPNTGEDITNEILKKKETRPAPPTTGFTSVSSTPPPPTQDDHKAQIQAKFAAQVLARASSSPTAQTEEAATTETAKTDDKEADSNSKLVSATTETEVEKPLDIPDKVPDVVEQKSTPEEVVQDTVEKNQQEIASETDVDEKNERLSEEHSLEDKIETDTKTSENAEVESAPVDAIDGGEKISEKVDTTPVVEENITEHAEAEVEALPESETSPEGETGNELDEGEKSEKFQVAKKKKKNRFKDIDAKDNNDMLSAFTDKPEQKTQEPEPPKVPEKDPEDATWEDKEKTIEKEVIRNEDAEEPEIVPKTVETKIVKPEDSATEEEKLQYDRDFLLKFQFAPICTSKPAGLPDIDIVLKEAHAPTKALVPGQRISASNDFMPNFMRGASGGRSSGGGKSRSGRGNSGPGVRQQKVISIPQFEKLEFRTCENAWVRPSEKAKSLSEQDRVMDELERNVRSILNKLTPQMFKELVERMNSLAIDTAEKLELTIDLIFEKAINEPGFSVAYANMCRVLTDTFKNRITEANSSNPVTFRKLLLNKCQKEFEKESSDEKLLEEDRNKTFETEAEKKAWKEELDLREQKNRRRMLGNIRFIGELFKLKMISENIMHDCIFKLLRADKQDSLEDQLECLCKLLATIGKDLDHPKAKPRMDQYFVQIKKIIEKKKISSRIKFALIDVIELRQCNWVPRRDDTNPKTVDQIQREGLQQERENEMQRQQDKLHRKLEPRGGRGGGRDSRDNRDNRDSRDSQASRSGGMSQSSEGWTSVPSKSGRPLAATPVDVSKFKMSAKKDSSEISLGPGGQRGAWSRGASGGTSRSGSGSNTPTNEIEQRPNRFDLLSESSLTPGAMDGRSRSGKGAPFRKGSAGGRGLDDRSSALRAVKDITSKFGRNQSPHRSSPSEDLSSAPSSRSQTPIKSLSPNPITEEKLRKLTKSTAEEYFNTKDMKEAILCIKELNAGALHHLFVEELITLVVEKKSEQRRMAGALLHDLLQEKTLSMEQMFLGFTSMVEFAQDLACDVPLIYNYLGEVLGPIVYDGVLPLNKVKDTLEPLVELNKAGLVMAEALSVAVQISGKEDTVAAIWSQSNITWNMLLSKNDDVEQFIKDQKMDFTLRSPMASKGSHTSQVQEELRRLLNESRDVSTPVIEFIEDKFPPEVRNSEEFIRELTENVCSSVVTQHANKSCDCDKKKLEERKNILLRYINQKKNFELHAVFALQQFVNDLEHPIDLLRTLFEELYQFDVISEETFYVWENSKNFPDGKGTAISSVKGFLNWLRKAEEEPNDDDNVAQTTDGGA